MHRTFATIPQHQQQKKIYYVNLIKFNTVMQHYIAWLRRYIIQTKRCVKDFSRWI